MASLVQRAAGSRLRIYSDELVIGNVAKAAFELADPADDNRLAIPHVIISDGMSLSVSATSAKPQRRPESFCRRGPSAEAGETAER